MIKKMLKDSDKVLLITSIVLLVFGLFNIVTVSSQEVTNNLIGKSLYYYFDRQLLFIIVGLIPVFIIMMFPLKRFYKYLFPLFLGVLFLNIIVIIKGGFTRGATNWLKLGSFSIQPSELAKPVVIFCVAYLLDAFYKIFKNPKTDHSKQLYTVLIAGLLIPALVFGQKDIGTCAIIGFSFMMMFIFSPINSKDKFQALKAFGLFVIVALLGIMLFKGSFLTGAQESRLNYFNPCQSDKYMHGGYQVCNAFIAINRGNLTGVGIGKSTQKYSYIPEPHTDMVFAIISEEYGFFVGILIILAYALILYRILKLSSHASTICGRYICLGVASFIFAHIFINLGGLFGLIPLTGVPLPFLSYGGSFVISLLVSLALVQRVHIDTKRAKTI